MSYGIRADINIITIKMQQLCEVRKSVIQLYCQCRVSNPSGEDYFFLEDFFSFYFFFLLLPQFIVFHLFFNSLFRIYILNVCEFISFISSLHTIYFKIHTGSGESILRVYLTDLL